MTFEEQLTRAFDTLTDRLRGEIDSQLRRASAELIAAAPYDRDPAVVEARPRRAERAVAAAREQAHQAGHAAGEQAARVAALAELESGSVAARARTDALREGARTGTSRPTERLRSLLVVAQVTATVVLLMTSGLLLRALWRVQSTDPGFRVEDVQTFRTALPFPRYEQTMRRAAFYRRVLGEVRQLPGVSQAAYISFLPMTMRGGIWAVVPEGATANENTGPTASLRFVTPGFFDTMRIPLRLGRDISDGDDAKAPHVAVVSESFVRRHWPGLDPIGRRFFFAFETRTVVGVVGDVRVRGLERTSEPQVYLSYQQVPDGWLVFFTPKDLVVRSRLAPDALRARGPAHHRRRGS